MAEFKKSNHTILKDGSIDFENNQSMDDHKITDALDGRASEPYDYITKQQTDTHPHPEYEPIDGGQYKSHLGITGAKELGDNIWMQWGRTAPLRVRNTDLISGYYGDITLNYHLYSTINIQFTSVYSGVAIVKDWSGNSTYMPPWDFYGAYNLESFVGATGKTKSIRQSVNCNCGIRKLDTHSIRLLYQRTMVNSTYYNATPYFRVAGSNYNGDVSDQPDARILLEYMVIGKI